MSTATAARVALRVQPGAKSDALLGKHAHAWKISLRAPAAEGKANRACVEFIAGLLQVRRADVAIIKGKKSRDKVIAIEGLADDEVNAALHDAVMV